MPEYVDKSAILTLAPGEVGTITFTVDHKLVEVSNWGLHRLSVTTDGSTPVADGGQCDHVEPGGHAVVESYNKPDTIKAISAEGTSWSVRGVKA